MPESNLTKKAIAVAAKGLTKEKPFDKMSVGDIAKEAGINRQTFYYHFQDKYEMLSWIYYNEAFLPIMEGISFENWTERIVQLFLLMKQEQYFYLNTIKYAENYFQEYMMKIAETIIHEAIDSIDEIDFLQEKEKVLFAKFYAYGVCGTVVEWATTGMKMPAEELAAHLKRLAIANEKAATTGKLTESFDVSGVLPKHRSSEK